MSAGDVAMSETKEPKGRVIGPNLQSLMGKPQRVPGRLLSYDYSPWTGALTIRVSTQPARLRSAGEPPEAGDDIEIAFPPSLAGPFPDQL